jgi:SAM-dependent methyltransferase
MMTVFDNKELPAWAHEFNRGLSVDRGLLRRWEYPAVWRWLCGAAAMRPECPGRYWPLPLKSPGRLLAVGAWHCALSLRISRDVPFGAALVCVDREQRTASWPSAELTPNGENDWGERTAIICCDATRMPFVKDGWFDAAFAVSTVEHNEGGADMALMREVRRVLRPGGLFVLTVEAAAENVEYDPTVGGHIYSAETLLERLVVAPGFDLAPGYSLPEAVDTAPYLFTPVVLALQKPEEN